MSKVTITAEWTANYSYYGPRRLHKHLARQGHPSANARTDRGRTLEAK